MAFDQTLASIEKRFGKGSLQRLVDKPRWELGIIPSGCITLDLALGIGGYPLGRIVEIYGPESSGKTTLATHAIAEAQKLYPDKESAFIDAEHALDGGYTERLGVDVNKLLISQPDCGEDALEIALDLLKSGHMSLIVVDSVAALTPRAEINGDIGDSHVGLQARMMSQAMRKMAGIAEKNDTTIIFINQLREKIGVMFGSPEVTPGGRALKFYSSVRLDVRRIEQIKQGTDIVGGKTKVKIAKNKVAPPFQIAEFDIMYGEGISQAGSILDLAVDLGVIPKKGAWYYDCYGEQLGQGRENAKLTLVENPDMMTELYEKVMEAIHDQSSSVETTT